MKAHWGYELVLDGSAIIGALLVFSVAIASQYLTHGGISRIDKLSDIIERLDEGSDDRKGMERARTSLIARYVHAMDSRASRWGAVRWWTVAIAITIVCGSAFALWALHEAGLDDRNDAAVFRSVILYASAYVVLISLWDIVRWLKAK